MGWPDISPRIASDPVPEDLAVFRRAVQAWPTQEDLRGPAVVCADLESFRRALSRP
jgi:hypothetical protein